MSALLLVLLAALWGLQPVVEVLAAGARGEEHQLCDVGEFLCHDRITCVSQHWLCDGESDCPDDSDESVDTCESHAINGCPPAHLPTFLSQIGHILPEHLHQTTRRKHLCTLLRFPGTKIALFETKTVLLRTVSIWCVFPCAHFVSFSAELWDMMTQSGCREG
uniref:Uncharacterized protein n=1 Tax=Coturnix japonica TaxID=93934 RepID=A0A8C2UF63_COTJA